MELPTYIKSSKYESNDILEKNEIVAERFAVINKIGGYGQIFRYLITFDK